MYLGNRVSRRHVRVRRLFRSPSRITLFAVGAMASSPDSGSIAYAAPGAELIADPAALDAHLTATKKPGIGAARRKRG